MSELDFLATIRKNPWFKKEFLDRVMIFAGLIFWKMALYRLTFDFSGAGLLARLASNGPSSRPDLDSKSSTKSESYFFL